MPGILFNNVWMLAGLVALSVPVIIHLLLRRKKKRVRFSTVQFFVKQDEQSSQRRKLRNWLLLTLRLLICTLLVLAFARPYQPGIAGAAGEQRKRQTAVVLDRSLSMQANASDGPKWVRAREAVRQILSGLKADDRAALISCAGRAEVLSAWAPAVAVGKQLNDLQPTCGTANLGEGLQQAIRLLSTGDPKAASTIYVVSDLQRSGCQSISSVPLPLNVDVRIIKVGDLVTPNLAITDLRVDGNDDAPPHAVLSSFSDEESPEVKLDFSVDGRVVSSRAVALGAGASTNVELGLPAMKPGWHDVAVQIHGHDALRLDDARFESVFAPEPVHVLVAESRRTSRSYEEESFFVTTALDPAGDSTNGVRSGFVFEKVSPDEVAGKLTVHPGGPLPWDLVIVPGLKQVPAALGMALSNYVRAGGGLLLFLGEGISAIRYNAEFRELLPLPLGNLEASPETDLGWRIGEYRTNTAIFGAFQLPDSGNLSLARFTRRFSFAPQEPELVAARFDDGVPLVLARQVGRGRVVLVNTSADTAWNDWPKHKTFVPWLHGTGHYLAGSATHEKILPSFNLLAGADGDVELGAAAAKMALKLVQPGGKQVALSTDDQGQLRDVAFSNPGIYSLRNGQGTELRRLAVNVSAQESDLAALSANDFQQQLARASTPPKTTLAAGLFGSGGNQKEFWRVLLLAVLVLLFLELLVANRTLA